MSSLFYILTAIADRHYVQSEVPEQAGIILPPLVSPAPGTQFINSSFISNYFS